MRRSLPTFLCAVLVTGLSACDQPVDGPVTDDEQALHDFRRAHAPSIPNYPGNGDLTMTRSGGGVDLDLDFDIINNTVYRGGDGEYVAELNGNDVASGGSVLCTIGSDGVFKTLSASDGTVLYSSLGPWVFDGSIDVTGLNGAQSYQLLSNHLLVSFDDNKVVDDLPHTGDLIAEASVVLDLATSERKLFITAMLDGTCGGDILSSGL